MADSYGSPIRLFYLFFCGMCMGAADLIPGISGGTVAFMMGFYDQLLDSLKTLNFSSFKLLFSGQCREFSQLVAWKFLLILGGGILFSLITLASFFHFILEHEVYRIYLYSAFLGLILASFFFCVRQVKEWKSLQLIGLVLGILTAYLLTGTHFSSNSDGPYAIKMQLNETIPSLTNYNAQQQLLTHLSAPTLGAMLAKEMIQFDTPIYNLEGVPVGQAADIATPYQAYQLDPWLIFCGAVAICALLLPGISGSYLLTLLGVYPIVIGALADFATGLKQFSFDQEAFYILFSLSIGILSGMVVFARFLSWLLKNYFNFTVATLSGFMVGALRTIWPFWSYEYVLLPLKLQKGPQLFLTHPVWPSFHSPFLLYAFFFALGSFAFVFVIEYAASTRRKMFVNNILY